MSTIRFLRTFLVAAKEGSFASAAERVALTQAAVGVQMRALETEFNTVLFQRSGRGIVLSAAGRALIPHARNLLATYDQMREGLDPEDEPAGTVTVGCIVSAMGLLSRTLVQMKPLYPRLNVRLVMQESTSLGQNVRNGELDAGIYVEDSRESFPDLLRTPLYTEPLTVVASSKVARTGSDIKKLLREQPFLRFDRRTPSGQRIEQTLRKLGIVPKDLLELSSLPTLVDLVRQNVGVAIVPHLKTADWANDPALCVLPLPGRPATRQIVMLEQARREHVTSLVRKQFVALLTKKTK